MGLFGGGEKITINQLNSSKDEILKEILIATLVVCAFELVKYLIKKLAKKRALKIATGHTI
jgi:hypothetical protein